VLDIKEISAVSAPESWRLEMAKTASELAYERLRQAIIDGEFEPGKRLTELSVAALFGISRTPVREAFFRLERDGLVRGSRGWGIEVVDPQQELTDIYHIREALEGRAARLAAERGSADELARIVRLAQASTDTDPADVETRARLNEEFHLAITAASHAQRLERLVGEYRELFASPRRLRRFTPEETRLAVADHHLIARAIQHRDADAAEAATRAHLRRAYPGLAVDAASVGAARLEAAGVETARVEAAGVGAAQEAAADVQSLMPDAGSALRVVKARVHRRKRGPG
jgi:DNA-binding GntR family transcriptional regulator